MSLEWDLGGKGVIQANQALGGLQFQQKRSPVVHHPEGPACTAHSPADSFNLIGWLFCGAL